MLNPSDNKPLLDLSSMCSRHGVYWTAFAYEGDCIVCTSHSSPTNGYTKVSLNGRTKRLHRLIYSFYNTDLTDLLVVRHLCNNTRCCNPKHLASGTQKDNGQDHIDSGSKRWSTTKPDSRNGLTDMQAAEIYVSNTPQPYLAKQYNVSTSTVTRIKNRSIFSSATEGLVKGKTSMIVPSRIGGE